MEAAVHLVDRLFELLHLLLVGIDGRLHMLLRRCLRFVGRIHRVYEPIEDALRIRFLHVSPLNGAHRLLLSACDPVEGVSRHASIHGLLHLLLAFLFLIVEL